MDRPDVDEYFLRMALITSERGTCIRRQVGCVIVSKDKFVLSTGYNGVPKPLGHCIDTPCKGAASSSGTGLNECEAIHAEQNALVRLKEFDKVYTVYCTTEPCVSCSKLITATSCKRVVYLHSYPSGGSDLLKKCGIESIKYELSKHRF